MPCFKYQRFQALTNKLNCQINAKKIWLDLFNAYQESHRHYHTKQHIDECLKLFDAYQYLATNPLEVEFALWFHDAIYNSQATDNEKKSALWAKSVLQQGNIENAIITRIYDLILISNHHDLPKTNDEKLLLDIDIGIFASDSNRFKEYQQQIRREYHWVENNIYQQKRQQILSHFYTHSPLYYCTEINQALNHQARINLQQALNDKKL